MTPEQGAEEMRRYRATTRRLLARRLGGSWDLERQPALRDWRKKIAASRNRIVHSGGLPMPSLARESCHAMFPLIRHIVDRACDDRNLPNYPMAALIVAQQLLHRSLDVVTCCFVGQVDRHREGRARTEKHPGVERA